MPSRGGCVIFLRDGRAVRTASLASSVAKNLRNNESDGDYVGMMGDREAEAASLPNRPNPLRSPPMSPSPEFHQRDAGTRVSWT